MKKAICIIILFFSFSSYIKAQSNAATMEEIEAYGKGPIFTKTEESVYFKGGANQLAKYLKENVNDSIPKKNGAPKGRYVVMVRFIVYKSGRISDIVAETNFGYGMEEEAKRVIAESPIWSPAIQNGNIVVAYKWQLITFIVE